MERLPIWRDKANVCAYVRASMSKSKDDFRPTGKGKHKKGKSNEGREKSGSKREKEREEKNRKRDWKGKEREGENEEAGEMKGISFSPWMPARAGYGNLPAGATDPDPEGRELWYGRLRYGINHQCMDGPGGKV